MPAPYARGYSLSDKGQWTDESAVLAPSVSWAAGVMISVWPILKGGSKPT